MIKERGGSKLSKKSSNIINDQPLSILFSGGTTFHTGLRMKIGNDYLPLDPESMNTLRKQFDRMMVVIVDEMSLIPADFLYNIHRRFKEIFINDEMFGDRGVMLVGDLLQIPPVLQTNHGKTYLFLK